MPGVVAASASRSTSGAERDVVGVHAQDRGAAGAVGRLHDDAAVEAPGAQQRRVEHVGAVGRGEHDDRLRRLEAVHLGEDLVERLLALVVGAGHVDRALARAPDRVELVDEDDRRRGGARLGEEVAHARGADADDRLDELRGRDREEGGVRLAGDGAREQRLAGPGGAGEEDAVGHATAEALVALRVLQEVDDLRQLLLGLVDAGDVGEGDADRLRVDAAGARAAELPQAAEAAAALGHAPGDEDEDADEQQRRPEAEQQLDDRRGRAGRRLRVDLDAVGGQQRSRAGRRSRTPAPGSGRASSASCCWRRAGW